MNAKLLVVVLVAIAGPVYGTPWTWTTLDYSGVETTRLYGISGGIIVGRGMSGTAWRSYYYDGSNWTMIITREWSVSGISNGTLVGYWTPAENPHYIRGLRYTIGGTWGAVNYPYSWNCKATDIDGNNIVGNYDDANPNKRGFMYDGTTWTTFEYPGASVTEPRGISGNNIVGLFYEGGSFHSFLYNGTTWTTLDYPGATSTYAYGIDGNRIVGSYSDDSGGHGFIYDGTTWTTLDYPGAIGTVPYDVDGNSIVGVYNIGGYEHGFLLTIPEPTTLGLMAMGALVFLRRRQAVGRILMPGTPVGSE